MSVDMPPPSVASPEHRKAALAQAVAREVAAGARVESQAEYQAILVRGKRPNHVLHLILTLITFFLWAPVWIVLAIVGRERRIILNVDEYGQTLRQQA